ncbi:MAG: family 16 glycosylhydrolase [Fibrobacter sp.]|nr:family 16 glycosylhydrolase [Fibrobacter sp.]
MEFKSRSFLCTILLIISGPFLFSISAQPSFENFKQVWSDEFNSSGLPDSRNWGFEEGYVRNNELQYYTKQREENARMEGGNLIIEARKDNWNGNQYTSASLFSRGKQEFIYGIFEMRAKIDVRQGSWPAFWTLGVSGEWPSNGEIDIMEYYAGKLHANLAWGSEKRWEGNWSSQTRSVGSDFSEDFHIWRMLWTEKEVQLWVDEFLQNTTDLSKTINEIDGKNPFHQKAYIMLNQAIGSNGGDPSGTTFPVRYLVDYVRVYQEYPDSIAPEIVDAAASLSGTISLLFSEGLDKASAENLSNYAVSTTGVAISGAKLQIDQKTVVLNVSGLAAGNEVSITVRDVKDDAALANTMSQTARQLTVAPAGSKLSGTLIGDGSPWDNTPGVQYSAAVDGNSSTHADCVGEATWVGYDFGPGGEMIISGFRYYPRSEYADRMLGRSVEVSSDGEKWEVIYKVPVIPPEGSFTSVPIVHSEPVRFVRYNGTGGYLNVNEVEFLGYPGQTTSGNKSGPTPANLQFLSNGPLQYSIYTVSGRLLESRVIRSNKAVNGVESTLRIIRSDSSFPHGLYLVTIQNTSNRKLLYKGVINR